MTEQQRVAPDARAFEHRESALRFLVAVGMDLGQKDPEMFGLEDAELTGLATTHALLAIEARLEEIADNVFSVANVIER